GPADRGGGGGVRLPLPAAVPGCHAGCGGGLRLQPHACGHLQPREHEEALRLRRGGERHAGGRAGGTIRAGPGGAPPAGPPGSGAGGGERSYVPHLPRHSGGPGPAPGRAAGLGRGGKSDPGSLRPGPAPACPVRPVCERPPAGRPGRSIRTGRPVAEDLARFFPATLELVVTALALAVVAGVPLGVISASRRTSWVDHLNRTVSVAGVSVPLFWLGVVALVVFMASSACCRAGGGSRLTSFHPGLSPAFSCWTRRWQGSGAWRPMRCATWCCRPVALLSS